MNIEKNTIYNTDCIVAMQQLKPQSIDMILCDLPYGTTDCRWDSIIPFDLLWREYERIIKPNGAIVLTAAQPFTTKLITSNQKLFRYCWYWVKNQPTGFTFAKYQPMRRVEDICVFYKSPPIYNPQGLKAIANPKAERKQLKEDSIYKMSSLLNEYTQRFTGYPNNVLEFKCQREGLHPTQKPVALFEYLIKTYTNEGDIVLDNTAGSGTTAIACDNTNRNFILVEIGEVYCKTAYDRINKNRDRLDLEHILPPIKY